MSPSELHFLSTKGISIRIPRPIMIYQYQCIKPFGEIEEDEVVFAGQHPKRSAMFLSEYGFGEETPISLSVFREHFTLYGECHLSMDLVISNPELLRYETKRLKNKKYFCSRFKASI